MIYEKIQTILKGVSLALLAVTLTATPSLSADVTIDLCATTGEVTMPDSTVVPIWGYVLGSTCTAGDAMLPSPELAVAEGDNLTINLTNNLTVPISVFIPGLAKPVSPVMQGDRLYSLDATVAAAGSGSYSWTTVNAGTYLYQSGTDVRTQVPMGMYGALVVSGGGYPAVAQDEVLLFSEIDPNLNADPAGFGGARVSNWDPQYFLINGATHPDTADLSINVSQDVLLRFVNAGLQTFTPTLEGGLYMDVIAEDGNLYPYPLTQYGLELQAGKTYDAKIKAGTANTYTLYDRAGHLENGGLVVSIEATAATGAPTALNDGYSTDEDTVLNVVAPGILFNDSDPELDPLTAVLVSEVSAGTLILNADGSFDYTPDPDFNGDDQFTYVANDGALDSNTATVTITVNPVNDAPVTVADAYDAIEGQILNVAVPGVLGNDTDVDGDSLTASPVSPPAELTLNSDGSFSYDATSLTAGTVVTFDYVANDGTVDSLQATVTITVTGAAENIPPIANDDTTSVQRGTTLTNYNIVANDEDPDGTIDPATVVITTGGTTQRGGTVTNNGDGTVTYTTPSPGWRGTDTLQYTVNDNDGATSNTATVRFNVVK